MKKIAFNYCLFNVVASLLFPGASIAGPVLDSAVDLATGPLTGSSGIVKPNLMFVFDTSLSMSQETAGDYLSTNNQCKMASRNRNGTAITGLVRNGTTLTITAPGHGLNAGTVVYLAVPGHPDYNGVYTITKRNLTTTSSTCTAYNTTTIVNNPSCNGATSGNPTADPPTAACSCNGSAPANVPNTTTDVNYTNPGSTNLAVCRWRDPRDNAPGTVCTASTPGTTTGDDTLEVTVLNSGLPVSGVPFSPAQITDARIMSRSDTTACSVAQHEPPIAAPAVNGLYYNPNVLYSPPPNPLNLATNLPAMNKTNTSNWNAVRSNGLSLNAAGVQNSGTTDITKWPDMVYCDTPNRPGTTTSGAAITSDAQWFTTSGRCKSNDLTTNLIATSPNYPYLYPNTTDGVSGTLSNTNFYANNNLRQQAATIPSTTNPVAGSFPFGEINPAANPFYYNINPIEYCTDKKLNDCKVGGKTSTYSEPSFVRYCKTSAAATDINSNPATTQCQSSNTGTSGSDFQYARYGLFERVEIKPLTTAYPPGLLTTRSGDRTDCASTSKCTYEEEMTNFANWYAYYRTRLQLMKTVAATTFNTLDENYRVGLMTVEGQSTAGNYLPISDFVSGVNNQKFKWFNGLYSRTAAGGTSLRDALTKVGRIYAGKKPITGYTGTPPDKDPVQYSCQQNFTLLTTDGYWNGDAGTTVNGGVIGNQDATADPPMKEGNTAPETLADVAMYYYQKDLRNELEFTNCIGALGNDVCYDDVKLGSGKDTAKTQHMTTFTLGLGIDGNLNYSDKYETDTVGDFAKIQTGTLSWPVPVSNQITAVDDLWHAAINGRGTYFSAKNPKQLSDGLIKTLLKIGSTVGTNTSTELSNSTPVSNDNYAYSARYTSGDWTGSLFARTITSSGVLSDNAVWCVENESSVNPDCTANILANQVANGTRSVLVNISGGSALSKFEYDSLPGGKAYYFSPAYLSEIPTSQPTTRLSQWANYTPAQKLKAGGTTLVNYLSGQINFDDRNDNNITEAPVADNRLYRQRAALLGDIVDSDPTYVGKAEFSYLDTGYSAFAASTAGRAKTVFVGANDGMLHAFDALTGSERWAFVPTTVMPNLYKLADKNYRNIHSNYVNGKITVADVFVSGGWKTILVSGLGQGGRGYFALDITDPAFPRFLWEVNASTPGFQNLGYSYGKPVITKKGSDWVVLFTSGYNNVPNAGGEEGDGKGRLYVLNAYSGTTSTPSISNGDGDIEVPSGLAQIAAFAASPSQNNQSQYVYGGDLKGGLWRFDIESGAVQLIARLTDDGNSPQPVTVAPVLARINGKRVIYVGTGKYLEKEDLTNANSSVQSFYAIRDDSVTSPITNLRGTGGTLVKQEFNTTTRVMSKVEEGAFTVKNGWYVDFATGERQNVKASLVLGILFVPTFVPPSGTCDIDGKGYLNAFDYLTGGSVEGSGGVISTVSNAPITGIYNIYDSAYPTKVVTNGDINGAGVGTTKDTITRTDEVKIGTGNFEGKRAIWRELVE